MDPISELKQEHHEIERELIELETIMESDVINYPNLVHTFKNLHSKWDLHENKEEIIFPVLERKQIKIPVEKMLFEHKELRPHKNAMINAINSGSEFEMKSALQDSGEVIIKKLREHINFEDEVLYRITIEEFNEKELNILWEQMIKQTK